MGAAAAGPRSGSLSCTSGGASGSLSWYPPHPPSSPWPTCDRHASPAGLLTGVFPTAQLVQEQSQPARRVLKTIVPGQPVVSPRPSGGGARFQGPGGAEGQPVAARRKKIDRVDSVVLTRAHLGRDGRWT